MSSKVIEISNNNADYIANNPAEFMTVLNPPLLVKAGSLLQVNKTFLDITGTGIINQEQFIFEEDIEISIEFGYYEQNNDFDYKEGIGESVDPDTLIKTPDFRYYILGYYETETPTESSAFNIYTETQNLTIPAGVYTATGLTKYINDRFSDVQKSFNYYTSYSLFGDTGSNIYKSWYSLPHSGKTFCFASPHSTPNINKFAGAFKDDRTDDKAKNIYGNQIYRYKTKYKTPNKEIPMIGSTQFDLTYNQDIFSFSFLHSPIYDASTSQNPIIYPFVFSNNNNLNIFGGWCSLRSGIWIKNLRPSSFWKDKLRFNLGKILPEITTYTSSIGSARIETIKITGDNSFNSSRTDSFLGFGDIDSLVGTSGANPTSTLNIPTDQKKYDNKAVEVTTTKSINSDGSYKDINNAGYFLLQLETTIRNQSFKDEKYTRKINGIISRQYENKGFVTGFSESSINELIKEDTLISSIKIKILDPITKELTEDIGENNSIFLSIFDPSSET